LAATEPGVAANTRALKTAREKTAKTLKTVLFNFLGWAKSILPPYSMDDRHILERWEKGGQFSSAGIVDRQA
jgi:hypothetical protein